MRKQKLASRLPGSSFSAVAGLLFGCVAIAWLLLGSSSARADEHLWAYARGAETLPKGRWELYFSELFKIGKQEGIYLQTETYPEIEYGITSRWQVALAPIFYYHRFESISTGPFADEAGNPRSVNRFSLGGVDVETKYLVLSPYKDVFGLALGFEYEYRQRYRIDGSKISQHSFVPKFYFQKNYLDDTLITVASLGIEFERRHFDDADNTLEEEISWDGALGVAYRIAPRWYVGVEGRVQADFLEAGFNSFNSLNFGDNFQYGVYVGPSLHYGTERWWATVSVLPQVFGGPERHEPGSTGGFHFEEHEKLHVRLDVGFTF